MPGDGCADNLDEDRVLNIGEITPDSQDQPQVAMTYDIDGDAMTDEPSKRWWGPALSAVLGRIALRQCAQLSGRREEVKQR